MNTYITGKVAIGLCDWIHYEVSNKRYNRAKFTKLLNMAIKYNTDNTKDEKRCVYDHDAQKLKFYYCTMLEKEVWLKQQIAC